MLCRYQLEFGDEIGFPHSEIYGSKVAHTSPQLIAACHVLHRLCMPRHPRNALTSRLITRTTNDNTECLHKQKLPTIIRTSNDFSVSIASKPMGRSITHGVRYHFHGYRSKKPIHNVKDGPTARCRKVRVLPTQLVRRQTGCLHPGRTNDAWRGGGAYRDRTDDLMLAKQPLSQLS